MKNTSKLNNRSAIPVGVRFLKKFLIEYVDYYNIKNSLKEKLIILSHDEDISFDDLDIFCVTDKGKISLIDGKKENLSVFKNNTLKKNFIVRKKSKLE